MNENLFEIGCYVEVVVWFLVVVVSILLGILALLLTRFGRLRLYVQGPGTPLSIFHLQRRASLQELVWANREDLEDLRLRVKQLEQSKSSKPSKNPFWVERE